MKNLTKGVTETEFLKIHTMKDRYRGFKMYLTAVSEQAKRHW